MKDKGSYDKQMLDGRKIQKKGNPRETEGFGVHSEAAWCGVVGVVCMLKGWSDGTVGKKDHPRPRELRAFFSCMAWRRISRV